MSQPQANPAATDKVLLEVRLLRQQRIRRWLLDHRRVHLEDATPNEIEEAERGIDAAKQ